ncbi:MAG: transporter substrate-binding domain-containing protein [Pseudomonas sp.]|uniref:substrate-binding periplasmic protein n=1 Tax=Pseudomonas abieticivorans TaxID=2931382 RepID=UPI0020BDAA2B|nr:transporter substrate-binding domain-containing protein [Pseudomonas sp. PIA16]MDE1167105.1 transporter substrate-binding domain-containing protein [Pseudomonas sp.]
MPAIAPFLTALLLTCLSLTAYGEKLRIVTEPWAPYVYLENGKAKGIDYEITALVFQRLGIDVQWEFLPWKRCLAMLDKGEADGVLDIFLTSERDAQLLYPNEPLSDVEFVLFTANARPHRFTTLDDLKGLTVGISPGYFYGRDFMDATTFKREGAPTHEANFGKLIRGRVDLVITDRRVGERAIQTLGLQGQVSALPAVISREKQYLAVRRGAGMDLLIQRFAAELRRFKREPAYTELLARYASDSETLKKPENTPKAARSETVEQHESSAL